MFPPAGALQFLRVLPLRRKELVGLGRAEISRQPGPVGVTRSAPAKCTGSSTTSSTSRAGPNSSQPSDRSGMVPMAAMIELSGVAAPKHDRPAPSAIVAISRARPSPPHFGIFTANACTATALTRSSAWYALATASSAITGIGSQHKASRSDQRPLVSTKTSQPAGKCASMSTTRWVSASAGSAPILNLNDRCPASSFSVSSSISSGAGPALNAPVMGVPQRGLDRCLRDRIGDHQAVHPIDRAPDLGRVEADEQRHQVPVDDGLHRFAAARRDRFPDARQDTGGADPDDDDALVVHRRHGEAVRPPAGQVDDRGLHLGDRGVLHRACPRFASVRAQDSRAGFESAFCSLSPARKPCPAPGWTYAV